MNTFIPWKTELLKAVKGKINKIKTKPVYTVLKQHRNVLFLTKLQEHFVLVPVDKASKNVCFICKQYYMQTLQDEIINSGNFALVNNEEGEITRGLKVYLQNYKLLDPANDKLPFLYWTLKMHKEPIEPRNITSGKDCITSNLSKVVCPCLQKLLNIEKKYVCVSVHACTHTCTRMYTCTHMRTCTKSHMHINKK